MFCILRIDASPGIADRNADLWTLMVLPRRFEDVQAQCAAVGHGLHSVANEVEKYLLQLDRETPDGPFAAVLLVEGYIVELHATRLQLENFVEQRGDGNLDGMLRFPIEAESLPRNVSHAKKLFFAQLR